MRMTPIVLGLLAVILSCIHLPSVAATRTLYDDSINNLLNEQGWRYVALGGTAEQSVVSGVGTQLLSDTPVYAGYVWTEPEALHRTSGYRMSFQLEILSESHSNSNRAGFSLIVLSSDIRGIELGFWTDEIWAQHDDNVPGELFTHGEGYTPGSTFSGEVSYQLDILGNGYSLRADNQQVLSGVLRDYTSFTGLIDPYETPNFIFLGDDTGSANAGVIIGQVTLETMTAMPLPAAVWLFGGALIGLLGIARRKKK